MIDRPARDKVVAVLAAYMRGDPGVDNVAIDDALAGYLGEDQTIQRIGTELWFTYDDLKSHPISVSQEGWKLYRRCLAFLMTDLELPDRVCDFGDEKIWPFQTWRDLYRSRPDLTALSLPRFVPARHDVPIRSPREMGIVWLQIMLSLVILLLLLAFSVWSLIR